MESFDMSHDSPFSSFPTRGTDASKGMLTEASFAKEVTHKVRGIKAVEKRSAMVEEQGISTPSIQETVESALGEMFRRSAVMEEELLALTKEVHAHRIQAEEELRKIEHILAPLQREYDGLLEDAHVLMYLSVDTEGVHRFGISYLEEEVRHFALKHGMEDLLVKGKLPAGLISRQQRVEQILESYLASSHNEAGRKQAATFLDRYLSLYERLNHVRARLDALALDINPLVEARRQKRNDIHGLIADEEKYKQKYQRIEASRQAELLRGDRQREIIQQTSPEQLALVLEALEERIHRTTKASMMARKALRDFVSQYRRDEDAIDVLARQSGDRFGTGELEILFDAMLARGEAA